MFKTRIHLVAVTLMAMPMTAFALPPLISVDGIVDPLVEARAADVVRKGCGAYSVNIVRAYREAKALESQALKMGYTKAQVQSFIKDKAAKTVVKSRANELLRTLGATGDEASLCAAGDRLVQRSAIAAKLISR